MLKRNKTNIVIDFRMISSNSILKRLINETKNLIIEFGNDKNKNGTFESYNEPIIIMKYDFKSEKLIEIIDKKINDELQKKLEGTEK